MCGKDKGRTRGFGSGGTAILASGLVDGGFCRDELVPCPDHDDGDDCGFADGPSDFHVYVRYSLR